jgi:hypothetical protein
METAQEIAARFAMQGLEPELERAILRHMEHHIKRAVDAERDAIIARLARRITSGKCPKCMAWDCAKDIAAEIDGRNV